MGDIHPNTLMWLEEDIAEHREGYRGWIEQFLGSSKQELESNLMVFRKLDGGKYVELFASFCVEEEEVSVLAKDELFTLVQKLSKVQAFKPKAIPVQERQARSRKGLRKK
ncbi:MAG: hypothetical protein AAGA06_12600 [Pseudomonadota bacterium]